MPTCHACRQDNPACARSCNACGSPLDGEARPLREERKVVTVLFADLVGFTARSERMDPEDVQRLLQPHHAQLRSVLERHGGTVAKFVGDAVMAIFGAPVAHEDDPDPRVGCGPTPHAGGRPASARHTARGSRAGAHIAPRDGRPGPARAAAPHPRRGPRNRRPCGSNGICGPLSASTPTISAPATDAARPSPPGGGSWRRWRRNNRSSSSLRSRPTTS
jgi:class 3 adenylate cyclase